MAYILMSGQDIRKLAVNVNAKQGQGFIPAGGLSYKDGTFYQFMAPTDIPDPALYGIVMTQSDLDFAARAALMPGAPLGTMIQRNAFFIQAFGTAVSDSGMIQIPLAVVNGGTGATTADGARINLNVDRVRQEAGSTRLWSANKSSYLFVNNNKDWGSWDVALNQPVPLSIGQGGTGAPTAAAARANLGINTAAAVADLATGADLPTTVAKVNDLLASLRAAGILATR